MATKDVSLWGGPGEGKTTYLASSLHCIQQSPIWLDRIASAEAMDFLQPTYRDLSVSRLPGGTTQAIDLAIADVSGNVMRVRDLRGGDSGFPSLGREDVARLRSAAAVLLILAVRGRASGALTSIETALASLPREVPKVLVLTKAELVFSAATATAFNARRGKLEDYALGNATRRIVEWVGWQSCWLTSVFGWRAGRPASRLGAFGQVLPYDICPSFVAEPFEHLYQELFG